jgi:hypothetical protein
MAYIDKDEIKVKREAIKKAFPSKDGWRFSVTGSNTSTLTIRLMQYPSSLNFPPKAEINKYHIDASCERLGLEGKEKDVIEKMLEIAEDGHWDESDSMTDYFNCAYYIAIRIGDWDKPAVSKEI